MFDQTASRSFEQQNSFLKLFLAFFCALFANGVLFLTLFLVFLFFFPGFAHADNTTLNGTNTQALGQSLLELHDAGSLPRETATALKLTLEDALSNPQTLQTTSLKQPQADLSGSLLATELGLLPKALLTKSIALRLTLGSLLKSPLNETLT